jgi:hypothetical protein
MPGSITVWMTTLRTTCASSPKQHAAVRFAGFPELSLTGSGDDLPAPPSDASWNRCSRGHHTDFRYCRAHAGAHGQRQKGSRCLARAAIRILRYPQGSGASLAGDKQLTIIDAHPTPNLDPTGRIVYQLPGCGDNRWRQSISTLQRFAHKYAIAVLMANACGGSALWDEKGQLIVRADKGELLLTGTLGGEGWQGDIIPLG